MITIISIISPYLEWKLYKIIGICSVHFLLYPPEIAWPIVDSQKVFVEHINEYKSDCFLLLNFFSWGLMFCSPFSPWVLCILAFFNSLTYGFIRFFLSLFLLVSCASGNMWSAQNIVAFNLKTYEQMCSHVFIIIPNNFALNHRHFLFFRKF